MPKHIPKSTVSQRDLNPTKHTVLWGSDPVTRSGTFEGHTEACHDLSEVDLLHLICSDATCGYQYCSNLLKL